MNVTSQVPVSQETPSQEYVVHYGEENLDFGDEGFLDADPRGRTTNYTPMEDKLIFLACKKVRLDPSVVTEQAEKGYWRSMNNYFNALNKSMNELKVTYIRHRWCTISTDCQKWLACLAHVESLNLSGKNDKDRVSVCILFFHQFIFPHCHVSSLLSFVEHHCINFVQRKGRRGREIRRSERKTIHIASLLGRS
jgi:hypothetical protein